MKNLNFESQQDKGQQEYHSIPEYELEEGIKVMIERINQEKQEKEENIIVGIAGGSASGKTSAVASRIAESFVADSLVLSLDDYYKGRVFMEQEEKRGNVLNWDQPEALDLDLFKKHLEMLKRGETIEKPIYDMKAGAPTGVESVSPKKVIIVEGLFALDDKLEQEEDLKVFVDIGTHGRVLRRLLRDIERTGQNPGEILKYFSQVVEPMHEKYIQSSKKNANLVIKNEFNPKTEAERSGTQEVQIKFEGKLDEANLRKIGAERIGKTHQVDDYYNPQDRDLEETGEILRIRQENSSHVLSYKGPQIESNFRERFKFEFEIDQETRESFLKIYGKKRKTIVKERTIYQLDGVIFSLDSVKKIENNEETEIGDFVEIRSIVQDREKLNNIIEKLGLSDQEGIKTPYFEM